MPLRSAPLISNSVTEFHIKAEANLINSKIPLYNAKELRYNKLNIFFLSGGFYYASKNQ